MNRAWKKEKDPLQITGLVERNRNKSAQATDEVSKGQGMGVVNFEGRRYRNGLRQSV